MSNRPNKSLLFRIARDINRKRIGLKNAIKYQLRKRTIRELRSVLPENVSIISSNCFAGRIYQDLKLQYLTPTAGLFFLANDFNEFCRDVRYYTAGAELKFVIESKNQQVNERRRKYNLCYPIGVLDNKVEIHFLHYKSENEAKLKWERRCRRINYDNLMFIGMEQNYCTVSDIVEFQTVTPPCAPKYYFSTKCLPDIQSNITMNRYNDEIGNAVDDCRYFYKELIKRLK